jgi:hypothetical protein
MSRGLMSRSVRSKQGLAAANARGLKLGGLRASAPDIRQYQARPHIVPSASARGLAHGYLRTASGSFLKTENIVGLAPEHGEDDKIAGRMAVSGDGSTTPLARFYGVPGRVERALPHLFPARASPTANF